MAVPCAAAGIESAATAATIPKRRGSEHSVDRKFSKDRGPAGIPLRGCPKIVTATGKISTGGRFDGPESRHRAPVACGSPAAAPPSAKDRLDRSSSSPTAIGHGSVTKRHRNTEARCIDHQAWWLDCSVPAGTRAIVPQHPAPTLMAIGLHANHGTSQRLGYFLKSTIPHIE